MKHSLLIVDDEEVICKGLSRVFMHEYTTYIARSGVEALDILKENGEIAVMLCDLMMPVMEGGELIEKIRAENEDIYIIALTAASSLKVCDAMKKGASNYMRKPFDIGQLEIVINRAVNSRMFRDTKNN